MLYRRNGNLKSALSDNMNIVIPFVGSGSANSRLE